MKLNLIYSDSMDGIMGVNNDLYCKLRSDLKMFQKITSTKFNNHENIVIMGYNTWKSIGKPLRERVNIVISKNHLDEFKEIDNIVCFQTLEECFQYTEDINYGKIFVIGGAYLFSEIMKNYFDSIDIIYQTQIMDEVNHHLLSSFDITYNKIPLIKYEMENKVMNVKFTRKKEEGEIFDFQKKGYTRKEIDYYENIYQKSENVNQQEFEYLKLLRDILEEGVKKDSRNSIVYSSFGSRMKFDLREGFPLLTTKKMPWKTVLRELLWFIQGSTSNQVLQDKNVHIWDANASKEFLKTRGLSYEEGDLGPIYGFQWRHFGATYVDHKTDYQGQGIDQLQWIIQEIQRNPTSRRLIMSSWNPVDLDKMALPPCHIMIQFNIEDSYIDAQLYQRSGDMFLGVPFNISSYSFLLHIIGKITGYTPRYFIHIIGDTHIYENHIEPVKEQLLRIPSKFPSLEINQLSSIDTIQESDFKIVNYNYYPTIRAEMVA